MVENSKVLGVKDAQKSLFEIWTEILQVPPSKKLVELLSWMNQSFSDSIRTQLTLQLDDPLKRSGKVPLAR